MYLTYDIIERANKEEAEFLIPAAQLPYNVIHKMQIDNPAHELVTAIVDICWVTDVMDSSRKYPSVVGSSFAILADNGSWTTLPLTMLNVQALETDIQESSEELIYG
jgi:hypothetical protein